MSLFKNFSRTTAEEFPTNIQFDKRDFFALFIIPLIVLANLVSFYLFENKTTIALVDTISRGILFLVVCFLYKKMLVHHWHKFNQARVSSYLLVILGAIVLQIVITLTRSLLPQVSNVVENKNDLNVNLALFIVSFGPVFTALLEDIIFRYTLLHKLFIPNLPIRILVIILNSIVFGLIHYYNFDGNVISTISFMAAGLFLNLIYIWTKNIWHVLLIHALNNFVLSTLGIIILWVLQK